MQHVITNKQPKGFHIFFLTEIWERYGFYVIQTLLIFYMSKNLHLDDASSYIIVGSFTALAYINCIFGGLVADRFLGSSICILLGGILLSIGYSLLALNNSGSLFDLSLAIITVGTGLLKPNITGFLSSIYANHNTHQKEQGYTIYYMGIYIGGLSGSLIGGYLQFHTTWSTAFFTSSIGGAISFITFFFGIKKYKLIDHRIPYFKIKNLFGAFVSLIIITLFSYLVLHSNTLSLAYFMLIGIFCLVYMTYCIITHHGTQKNKLIAFLFLTILSIVYWGIYFQQFFSLSLCVERVCDKMHIPASVFPAIESLGIIIFTPPINKLWRYFNNKNQSISVPVKFALGFLFNALAFLLISIGLLISSSNNYYLSPLTIIVAYLLIAIGELCIAPTALSIVTNLVPARYTSAMTGIALLTIGFGGKLAGLLANDTAALSHSLYDIQVSYMYTFFKYFIISIIAFLLTMILKPQLTKLISKGT